MGYFLFLLENMRKEDTILIQLTQNWASMAISMYKWYLGIFDIALDKWITDIREININQLLKDEKFCDENWEPYTPEEEKKIKKHLIHMFVGFDIIADQVFKTYDIAKLRDDIIKFSNKLKLIMNKLP